EHPRVPDLAGARAEALRSMMGGTATRVTILLGVALAIAGCQGSTSKDVAAWRTDCPSTARPEPLSLEGAREAQRLAARRQELRMREAAEPGSFMRAMHAELDPKRVAAGQVCLAELADLGRLLFEHEYDFPDGLGGGGSARSPAGPFRRVHGGLFGGPETIS